ncbi:hypothetical protein GCM10011515_10110 [Tsuneonella deserti]|uniref:YtxH-like protein n=1 Tax=Tsuneonella deserti TaxID=2035528 RepID=A0ABQ1S3K4_9SPHN|nr:hypothetical protein [Tsuneonella deserti]GGD92372.1 hypothetical protein GCM10011515_10110 [Tsuneonella deserti]
MSSNDKRDELKSKVDAAQKRNQQRTLGDYAREAGEGASSFVKERPLTTILGGVAVGVLIASLVPGPGRRLRKKATKRGAALAAVIADLAVTYGSRAMENAGDAARSGQSRLSDLGETLSEVLSEGARNVRREAGDVSEATEKFTRHAGKRASRTLRNLRSRMSN